MSESAPTAEWPRPVVGLPSSSKHPLIACTAEELARLRAAHTEPGVDGDYVRGLVVRAVAALDEPLNFPPRGGQHNQWYQCEPCQMGLETIDESHHRCPKCGKIYSGRPYDDAYYTKRHGEVFGKLASSAWAYAITGERRFAELARLVLLGYAERYLAYPYHSPNNKEGAEANIAGAHIFAQTLSESSTLSRTIAPAYDLIHDSGALSPEDHSAIRDRLIAPMLRNIVKNPKGKSNWQTWHNAAMVAGGAVLGNAEWIERGLNDPDLGFVKQMSVSVTPEGLWYENSWHYHFYTLQGLVTTAETCRRIGIDLWSHPRLKAMFTLAVRYTMPDGSLPRNGDSVQPSATGVPWIMAAAAHAYGDPAIAALVRAANVDSVMLGIPVSSGESLPRVEGSDVFEGAGHAILRTEGPARLAAVLTFSPFGGFHTHYDKLSFVFFAHGRELGVDPGNAKSQAYRLPIHTNWYRATLSHNAVVVDGVSQEPAGGKLELFATAPTHAAAMASTTEAYPGVEHRRLLLLTPRYLLVLDELRADRERRFDWWYHHRGETVVCATATEAAALDESYVGAMYLQNLRGGASSEPIAVTFSSPGVDTRLLMDAQPHTRVHTADGPGSSVTERIPLAAFTRRGQTVRFAAVLEPVATGEAFRVESVEMKAGDTQTEVLIRDRDGVDRLVLRAANALQFFNGERLALKSE